MAKTPNLVGMNFGRLTVIERNGSDMREWARRNNVDRKKVRELVKGGMTLEQAMKNVVEAKNG